MSIVHNDPKDFIAKYKAAIKAKLTREEFAHYLDIMPKSVVRRRLNIAKMTGLNLPYLKVDTGFDGSVEVAKFEAFEKYYNALIAKDEGPKTVKIEGENRKGVYVITSAQNATPVHEGFLATMLKYCELRNGELMVIPYRYKNPTSIFTPVDKAGDWWWEALSPFILANNIKLCKGLQILGQIKMQPTQTTPLSGFDGRTGTDSAILGHPKVQWKTVATPSKKTPKILATTGSCTVENYTDSKTGHRGAHHHNISAIIVEVDDNEFHMRRIDGNEDGTFYDIEYYYTPTGRTRYGRAAGFIPGDIHAEFIDKTVEYAMFDSPTSIANVLNPEVMAYHDVEDFWRRNHHHRGNDILAYGKHHYGRDNVEEGLQISADFIDNHTRPDTLNLIIRGNHDEAFDRWLRESDPKSDPENAKFYYYMKFHQLSHVAITPTGFDTFGAFEYWCTHPLDQSGLTSSDTTTFMKRDASFVICGIEIGFHGDQGINGGRGSIGAYSKIGPKTVIGHSHSPGIVEGAYQVGVSSLVPLEYSDGPSSWLHTHCIIYPNGARTLINVINGKWRASYYGSEFILTD